MSEPLPETGQPFEGLMDLLFDVADRGVVLRICVLSLRTHLEHLQVAMRDIEAAIREVLAEVRI